MANTINAAVGGIVENIDSEDLRSIIEIFLNPGSIIKTEIVIYRNPPIAKNQIDMGILNSEQFKKVV